MQRAKKAVHMKPFSTSVLWCGGGVTWYGDALRGVALALASARTWCGVEPLDQGNLEEKDPETATPGGDRKKKGS